MTKYEKAVLRACEARFKMLMEDDGITHPMQAIKMRRGKIGLGVSLVRACARWQASKWQSRR